METTVQYHLSWKFWYWEGWHQKISEEGFDSIEDFEGDEDMTKFMKEMIEFINSMPSHPNICDLEIVKVTTNYETVKVIK